MEKIHFAELSSEQLEELNALETKLGVTLIAYESQPEATQSELQ